MSAITDKIHSRGYWRIVIRPTVFLPDRIQYKDLLPTLQRVSVQTRSIGFPHIDSYQPLKYRELKWIGHEFDFLNFIEAWRFYQSGQFAQRSAMWLDWRDQATGGVVPKGWVPGSGIGMNETVIRFTEIFELASRLSLAEPNLEGMRLDITICNIQGRFLFNENPMQTGFAHKYTTSILEFPYVKNFSRQELISQSAALALDASTEFFARFDWSPTKDFLKAIQSGNSSSSS